MGEGGKEEEESHRSIRFYGVVEETFLIFSELWEGRKKVALRLIHPQESKIRNGLLSGRICSIRISIMLCFDYPLARSPLLCSSCTIHVPPASNVYASLILFQFPCGFPRSTQNLVCCPIWLKSSA